MKKLIIYTFFVLGFLLPFNANAQGITLAYVEFPPYEFEKDGKPEGALVQIVQTIFQKANIPLTLVPLPFKRAFEEAKSGTIDGLFNFYKTDERLALFDYTDTVIKNPLVFFVRKDSPIVFQNLADLKGLKVGVMTGYTYGTDFDTDASFQREPADAHESNFKKLVMGRLDAYPCDKLVGIYTAVQNDLMSELKILPTPLKVMDGYIGFTKNKHRSVIKKINKVIEDMNKNGEIEAIIDRYVVSNP